MEVYLLFHVIEPESLEEIRDTTLLLGVFSNQETAENAKRKALTLPYFSKHSNPEYFNLDAYQIDETGWEEGFGPVDDCDP